MDVILHIGAHRTGSTSFQQYLRANRSALMAQGVGFWGPWRTRKGLLDGVADRPVSPKQTKRAIGRVQMNLAGAARQGVTHLVVSDENLIGTARRSLRARVMYPDIGERMARINAAFDPITRVVLQIRSPDRWWGSVMAYLVPRGESVPSDAVRDSIAHSDRSWRHVITDIACACPDAEILVTPFERFASHPDELLAMATQKPGQPGTGIGEFWANRSPNLQELREVLLDRGDFPDLLPDETGRWQPFTPFQASALREAYADDLYWLRAGAEGLAHLREDPMPARSEKPTAVLTERGQAYDRSARRLEETC
ncbi:hypothetical protein J7443_13035 [Tropicibacter sp. R15_0]|nr:hypothetical protein [Tropicibacter sp. R15_0]